MKLAYFSPLSPQRSGISDYSEELVPHLAAGAEITLFVDGFQPMNRELTSRFDVRDYRRQRSVLNQLARFDAVVYHLGNDHRYHAGIVDAMQRRRGVVVFHDFALHDFFLGLARERRDLRVYLDEVEFCHGDSARAEAAAALARGAGPSILARPIEFPLNSRIANEAEGIIVHSEWSRSRFAQIAPGVPVRHIPMPVKFSESQREESTSNEVKIASFGLITPGKGIEHALRALSALKSTHRFRYSLVGETNAFYDVRDLVRRYAMEDCVEITGHVTLEEFKRRINETDIALNLRERTVGETSASLCRLMAAGVCSVVADVGWYAELPGDCVVKIPLNSFGEKLLPAYLQRLIEDAGLRTSIGENARRLALDNHSLERGAHDYLTFIGEIVDSRLRRRFLADVSNQLRLLGVRASDGNVLRGVAEEVAAILPERSALRGISCLTGSPKSSRNGSQNSGSAVINQTESNQTSSARGRMSKVRGVDFKRAAAEYSRHLDAERRHYLLTKPFYNLANKPPKHAGDGMDAETFRHFCDFANIAVALGLPAGSRILDVGCGSGWLSEYLARLGYTVKGIDISADLVEMARERITRVPYDVDHQTSLLCMFEVHDVELSPLAERFDAVICYDSLHHFEDERAVMRHIATMLEVGGLLFVLEGERPPVGSPTEDELVGVMHEFGTLESPFDYAYLRKLLDDHGFAIVGDYTSVNGLFEREMLEDNHLPLAGLPTNYYYLLCKKVSEGAPASTIPDSRRPRVLRARFRLNEPASSRLTTGQKLVLSVEIENIGDTIWLTGRLPRAGIVMPAVQISDEAGTLVDEFHGEPPLPRAVAPGETVQIKVEHAASQCPGRYTLKLDLVDQHICWFEQQGSEPLVIEFEVVED